jgi:hypothetical protein
MTLAGLLACEGPERDLTFWEPVDDPFISFRVVHILVIVSDTRLLQMARDTSGTHDGR